MWTLLSQEATLRISALGEKAMSEMESSGPGGTGTSSDVSTVVVEVPSVAEVLVLPKRDILWRRVVVVVVVAVGGD
jgi:hypothetical protein